MTGDHGEPHQLDLKALADRYAVVSEAMSEGVYDWDVATNTLDVSGRLNEIIGVNPAELTAEDWNQRIHADDFATYRDAIRRHFRGETDRLYCEYRIRRVSGDYIWIADSGRCLRTDTGHAYRLIGAIRDITGRKLAERKLKAAQAEAETARLQLLDAIESISEGIVLFDADDRIILCNSNYQNYFAQVAGADVGQQIKPGALFWDIVREAHARGMLPLIDDQGGIDAYIDMRKEVRRSGPSQPIEQLLADGRWLQIREHKTATGGTASVYTDITELKTREVDLSAKTEMLESLSSRLSKYLSPQVYASIFSAGDNIEIAPKRKKLTVFFSDIVGFTPLVDQLESEELTDLLNQYLTEMSKIAIEHGATVDKFIGDAIVAFFGDPVSNGVENDAKACVAMALAMQSRLVELRRNWRNKGLDETFNLRVGVATGFCTVGNFGSEDRLDYTAIGSAVNRAARLQTHAETGGILLDNETYHLVKDKFGPATETKISAKGIAEPIKAFAIMASPAQDQVVTMLDRAGVQITIDKSLLTTDARHEALQTLECAINELKNC